jgi:tRNA(Ile)-lysidine synthase
MPLLVKNYNPNLVENLVHTAEILRDENEYIKRHVEKIYLSLLKKQNSDFICLSLNELIKKEKAIKRRIIRYCYELLNGSSKDFTFKHVESVLNLAENSQVGSIINLPKGISAKKGYNELEIGFLSNNNIEDFSFKLSVPGDVYIPALKQTLTTEVINKHDFHILNNKKYLTGKWNEVYLDFNEVPDSLVVRNRRKGDYFVPYGMHGTKKLKDFFIDEKVPREKRSLIPLVACGEQENNIIWVVGFRIAHRYRIKDNVDKILKLKLIQDN